MTIFPCVKTSGEATHKQKSSFPPNQPHITAWIGYFIMVTKRKRNSTVDQESVSVYSSKNGEIVDPDEEEQQPKKKRNVIQTTRSTRSVRNTRSSSNSSNSTVDKIKQQEEDIHQTIQAQRRKAVTTKSDGEDGANSDTETHHKPKKRSTPTKASNVQKKKNLHESLAPSSNGNGSNFSKIDNSIGTGKGNGNGSAVATKATSQIQNGLMNQRKKCTNQSMALAVDNNSIRKLSSLAGRPPRPPPPPLPLPHVVLSSDQKQPLLEMSSSAETLVVANKIPESPESRPFGSVVGNQNSTGCTTSTTKNSVTQQVQHNMTSNMIHVPLTNTEEEEELEEDEGAENIKKVNHCYPSRKSYPNNHLLNTPTTTNPKKINLFQSFLLYTTTIIILFLTLYDQHQQILKQTERTSNTILLQKRQQLKQMNHTQNSLNNTLQSTLQSLQSSQQQYKECTLTKQTMEQNTNTLQQSIKTFTKQLQESQAKIDTIAGSEEDIRHNLTQAWNDISSLQKKLLNVQEESNQCHSDKNLLLDEKDTVESRIIELEFTLVEADERYQDLESRHEQDVHLHHTLQKEIQSMKEMIDRLEDQLDKEDGRAWYYQLQIKHLEGIIDDQDETIMDVKHQNEQLNKEKKLLEASLNLQVKEAVYALNAVAKSATMKKAEEWKQKEQMYQIEKNNIMKEAANAVQSVVSAKKRMSAHTVE